MKPRFKPRPPAPPPEPFPNGTFCHRRRSSTVSMGEELVLLITIPVILLILLTNFAVFIAVFTEKRLKSLRTTFIVSLALADFLVGSISLPLYVGTVYHPSDLRICVTFVLTVLLFMASSMMNLIAVSIERWIAIFKPLRYHNLITFRTVGISLLVVWIVPVLLASSAVDFRKDICMNGCKFEQRLKREFMIFMTLSFIIVCFVMGYMQLKVYSVIQEHRRRVVPTQTTNLTLPKSSSRKHAKKSRRTGVSTLRDFKMTIAMNTVYLAFVFAWTPQVLLLLLYAFGFCMKCEIFITIFGTVAAINSAINPLIYAMRMREFRRPIRKIFCLLCCCRKDLGESVDFSGSRVSSIARRDSNIQFAMYSPRHSFVTTRSREGSDSSSISIIQLREAYFTAHNSYKKQSYEPSTVRRNSVTFADSAYGSESVKTETTIQEFDIHQDIYTHKATTSVASSSLPVVQ